MLIDLYFGDYYDDGHGKYHHVPVEGSSKEQVEEAIEKVKQEYPHFFTQFAYHYQDSSIGPEVEKALLDCEYPIERFCDYMDDNDYECFNSLAEVFESELWEENEHAVYTIEFVADAVIWVLNRYGAGITETETLHNPHFTFTAGYGLFY